MKKIFLFLFLTSYCLTLFSDSFDNIKNFNFKDRMDFFNIPGVSISIVSENDITWQGFYGNVDDSMLFQAASFSKSITALGVFKLIDSGLLDLDTNVNQYLKDWKIEDNIITRNRKITLRLLLSHMSGIDESGPRGYLANEPTLDDLLKKINIRYYPGLKRRYSWSGYTIIEKVIEDITGLSFKEYITNEILKPLGMNNSTFDIPENHANGYDLFGDEIDGGFRKYPELAASGLWSTTGDIAKYIIEINKIYNTDYEGIITKSSVKEMLSYQKGGWGLGVSLKFKDDNLIFRHSGKNAGFTNYFISRVVKGQAIIIMTNSDNAWKLIMEIIHFIDNYKDWGI